MVLDMCSAAHKRSGHTGITTQFPSGGSWVLALVFYCDGTRHLSLLMKQMFHCDGTRHFSAAHKRSGLTDTTTLNPYSGFICFRLFCLKVYLGLPLGCTKTHETNLTWDYCHQCGSWFRLYGLGPNKAY